ncbi:hypothetical protein EW026_g6910 [Hermanssonia centrifuga]|uniref:Pali-domain-containing protein n=1 Tax=Hermanssonia centrifuga TaxID=98765 RepID=A0A4S4K9J7_9APHY|nr:hypothetical protein EW026_g6910 [Hermanssonia centrifuga]
MLAHAITSFLIFTAFLLLLLVSISVPVIKTIYLFRLAAQASTSLLDASASAFVRFGVWGYCISSVNVSVIGIDGNLSPAQCSKAKLGYDFDGVVQAALRAENINSNTISHELTAVLVLHPIGSCGFTFLALLASLFIIRRHAVGVSRGAALLTLGLGLLSALLTTVIFLIDVILVAIVKTRIKNDTDGDVTGTWGNAVWMILGAAVALWGALIGTIVTLLRGGRKARASRY